MGRTLRPHNAMHGRVRPGFPPLTRKDPLIHNNSLCTAYEFDQQQSHSHGTYINLRFRFESSRTPVTRTKITDEEAMEKQLSCASLHLPYVKESMLEVSSRSVPRTRLGNHRCNINLAADHVRSEVSSNQKVLKLLFTSKHERMESVTRERRMRGKQMIFIVCVYHTSQLKGNHLSNHAQSRFAR